MITNALVEYPDLSVRRLCAAVGVSRTWWYSHPAADAITERDTSLRDAIEQLVLEFPG